MQVMQVGRRAGGLRRPPAGRAPSRRMQRMARGCGAMTTALRASTLARALKIVVEVGLVTGTRPATTPTGSAITTKRRSGSRSITPDRRHVADAVVQVLGDEAVLERLVVDAAEAAVLAGEHGQALGVGAGGTGHGRRDAVDVLAARARPRLARRRARGGRARRPGPASARCRSSVCGSWCGSCELREGVGRRRRRRRRRARGRRPRARACRRRRGRRGRAARACARAPGSRCGTSRRRGRRSRWWSASARRARRPSPSSGTSEFGTSSVDEAQRQQVRRAP